MGAESRIGWTDATFNPWRGCTKVSEGCANCYAERQQKRWGHDLWGSLAERKIAADSAWKKPLTWNRKAKETGKRTLVFCGSLCDVFEDRPDLVEPRKRLLKLIHLTPNLCWLMLTKRPENVSVLFYSRENVWIGVSIENESRGDERLPGRVARMPRVFLSCEPLLGDISKPLMPFIRYRWAADREDRPLKTWAIVGGESGPGARHMDPRWAAKIRDICDESDVPFFFKQLGGGVRGKHHLGGQWSRDKMEYAGMMATQEFPDGIRDL